MNFRLPRFLADDSGVTSIEYGILAASAAIAIGAVVAPDGTFGNAIELHLRQHRDEHAQGQRRRRLGFVIARRAACRRPALADGGGRAAGAGPPCGTGAAGAFPTGWWRRWPRWRCCGRC